MSDFKALTERAWAIRQLYAELETLRHGRADCLWSVLTLARLHEVDREASFLRTMDDLEAGIAARLTDAAAPR